MFLKYTHAGAYMEITLSPLPARVSSLTGLGAPTPNHVFWFIYQYF